MCVCVLPPPPRFPSDKRSDTRNLHCPAVCADIRQAGRPAPTLAHFNHHLQSPRWSRTQSPRFPHPSQSFQPDKIWFRSHTRTRTHKAGALLLSHHNPAASPWNAVYYDVKSTITRWQVFHARSPPPLWTCASGYDLLSSRSHLPSPPAALLFDPPIYTASERTLTPTGSCGPPMGCGPVPTRLEGQTSLGKQRSPALLFHFVIDGRKRVT